jgi:hypothetical protein
MDGRARTLATNKHPTMWRLLVGWQHREDIVVGEVVWPRTIVADLYLLVR